MPLKRPPPPAVPACHLCSHPQLQVLGGSMWRGSTNIILDIGVLAPPPVGALSGAAGWLLRQHAMDTALSRLAQALEPDALLALLELPAGLPPPEMAALLTQACEGRAGEASDAAEGTQRRLPPLSMLPFKPALKPMLGLHEGTMASRRSSEGGALPAECGGASYRKMVTFGPVQPCPGVNCLSAVEQQASSPDSERIGTGAQVDGASPGALGSAGSLAKVTSCSPAGPLGDALGASSIMRYVKVGPGATRCACMAWLGLFTGAGACP